MKNKTPALRKNLAKKGMKISDSIGHGSDYTHRIANKINFTKKRREQYTPVVTNSSRIIENAINTQLANGTIEGKKNRTQINKGEYKSGGK